MSLQHRLRSGHVSGSSYRKAKIRYVPRVSSLDSSLKRPTIVGLVVKPIGKPSAGNRHARFDERGWETERWPSAPSYRAHPRLYLFDRWERLDTRVRLQSYVQNPWNDKGS